MTQRDYDYLARLLKERSGLVLAPDKRYLLEQRLAPVLRKAHLAGLAELVQTVRSAEQLISQVVDAMATNETSFFRDRAPFEQLRDSIFPALMERRRSRRKIRIWCAAASSGQEPYSLAIVVREMAARLNGWSVDILASDISAPMLARAQSGRYSQFEVQRGLPTPMLIKYFRQVGREWEIIPELRSAVSFRPLNLLNDFNALGTFDVVFCRNVLMYFDTATKRDVLDRIAAITAPDGFVVLGGTETTVGITTALKPSGHHCSVFVPNSARAASAQHAFELRGHTARSGLSAS